MANIFTIAQDAVIIQARDKAIALAGEIGLNNLIGGHVLPPLPPFINGQDITITAASGYSVDRTNEDLSTQHVGIFGTPMCFPLRIKKASQKDTEYWLLPVEPMITIGGGHTLIRRNVAKSKLRGSIKERWNQDDYTITIQGLLTKKDDWTYPEADVKKLRSIVEAREPIDVECELLNQHFGIDRIAIEKFDFPFTKGEENQTYSISAYSDDAWDLFIQLDK